MDQKRGPISAVHVFRGTPGPISVINLFHVRGQIIVRTSNFYVSCPTRFNILGNLRFQLSGLKYCIYLPT